MPNLEEWNLQSLAVVQATLGAISPNYRMITLDHDGREWVISFVLAAKDIEDEEEIKEEFPAEWDALQNSNVARRVELIVSTELLAWPEPPVRVLYRRRETVAP